MRWFANTLPGHGAVDLRPGTATVLGDAHRARTNDRMLWRGRAGADHRHDDGVLLDVHDHAGAARARDLGLQVWWTCRTPTDVRDAIVAGGNVWLSGAEAAGHTGRVGSIVLLRALLAHDDPPPWVCAGLGPGARAATAALGATGVVVQTELWACEGSPLHADWRPALRAAQARSTTLVGEAARTAVRLMLGRHHDKASLLLATDPNELLERVDTLSDRWWLRPDAAALVPCGPTHMGPDDESVQHALDAQRADLRARLDQAARAHPLRPECDPLGTGVPIVQGPMANVSEGPGLAAAVRAAGAQPFIALSALDSQAARDVLRGVRHVDGVGAGIIAFDVATTRDEHLRLTREVLDGPIILAGGSPQLARRLQSEGATVWLHTPAPRLAGMAVASGVGTVILEGHEAGGHVGPLPSSVLWESGLDAVRAAVQQGRARSPLVILAGGVGDSVSAAFAALIAARACAAGVRVALQVGTAFLFTREIVKAGQITEHCQAMGLQAHETVLVGQTVNLPVRCLPNAGTRESRRRELRWAAEGLDTHTRRRQMEARNLGLSRLAAKGIERNPRWHPRSSEDRYLAVDRARQIDHGVFSFGQGAQVTQTVQTVRELVRDLTAGARGRMRLRLEPWGPVVHVAAPPPAPAEAPAIPRNPRCAVAIVGLGCVLPGAVDVPAFWRNQLRNADSVAQVPADRWSVERYHRPAAGSSGPAYSASCAAGAVRHLSFDGLRYRTPPTVQPTIDRAQIMALLAADEASADAGFQRPDFDGDRASVIFGNAMGGEWSKRLTLRVKFRDLLDLLVDEQQLDVAALPEIEALIEERLDRELVPLRADSMVGLLGNLVAGRVASWLGWRGGNHTVDAACAASLMAVAQGVQALRAGRCDAVLCGGSDGDLSVETYVGFTRTLALSSAGSRPFSSAADGFVMGEGAAAFALVRLDDAMAQDLAIWSVIHGVGQSSDGRSKGLTAPSADGQRLAIERAWADAERHPTQAAFIEAHGTGTDLGDRTEADVITQMFCGPGPGPWVGTAKSSLGHLKSAAGAAGLLRATLISATGVVPGTLHAGEPIDGASGLRLPRFPVNVGMDTIVGGVSAFGFGGTNVHLVIGSPPASARRPALLSSLRRDAEHFVARSPSIWSSKDRAASGLTPSPRVLLFSDDDLDALAAKVARRDYASADEPTSGWRLAIVATDDEPLHDVIAWMQTRPSPGAWLARRAVIDRGAPRPIVILGPGQGAQRMGAVRSVSRYACARDLLSSLAEPLGGSPTLARGQTDTRTLHRHLVGVGAAWVQVLKQADIPVHTAVGHSLGELTALLAAGHLSSAGAAQLANARGLALHQTCGGSMCAVHLPERAANALADGVHLAAINGPSTTVYAGTAQAIERVMDRARRRGVRTTLLAVAHPFHSPHMASAAHDLRQATANIAWSPPVARWISAGDAAERDDPSAALVDAIARPVRWHDALDEAMVPGSMAVELGPGRTLTRRALALGHPAVALDPDPTGDDNGPVRAAAALWCAGHPGLLRVTPRLVLLQHTSRRPVGPSAEAQPTVSVASNPQHRPPATDERAPVQTDPQEAVMSVLEQITGYERHVLRDATDLQAELGVDSIRRLEILGALQERLGVQFTEADQIDLDQLDVAGLVDLARRRLLNPQELTAQRPVRSLCATWERVADLALAAPTPMGWSAHDDVSVWRCPPLPNSSVYDAVVHATQAVLSAAADLPTGAHRLVAIVPDSPAGHAAAAAMRCVATESERPLSTLRVADIDHDNMVHSAVSALLRPPLCDAPCQVYRAVGSTLFAQRWANVLAAVAAPPSLRTVVVSGGLTGIVLPCALALHAEHVVVIGRRPQEQAQAALAAHGPRISYRQVDLLDAAATSRALRDLRDVDLIVHGAGVLRDAPWREITSADLQRVIGPKVLGLLHFRAALPQARCVAFSSVAAHVGNPGQLAYSAANAAIEALTPAIAWSAWADVGMASDALVQTAITTRGVQSLTPAQGSAAFVDLCTRDRVTVVTRERAMESNRPWPLDALSHPLPLRARLRLSPSDPALADHQIAGRCLVPAAVWIDAIAALLDHQRHPLAIAQFRVVAPTFVDHDRDDIYIELSALGHRATVTVYAGQTAVAKAMTSHRERPPASTTDEVHGPAAHQLYRKDLLFHGPTWQVLEAVEVVNGTIRARLAAEVSRAATLDAAHQLASMWMGWNHGHLGLPTSAAAWGWWSDDGPAVHLELSMRHHDGHTSADLVARNAEGSAVLQGHDVRLAPAGEMPAAARAVLQEHTHE